MEKEKKTATTNPNEYTIKYRGVYAIAHTATGKNQTERATLAN